MGKADRRMIPGFCLGGLAAAGAAAAAWSALGKIDDVMADLSATRRHRKTVGAFAVGDLLLAALLFYLLKKTYD